MQTSCKYILIVLQNLQPLLFVTKGTVHKIGDASLKGADWVIDEVR